MKNKNAANDISFLEYNIEVDVARMHLISLVVPWDIFLLRSDIIQLLYLLLTPSTKRATNPLTGHHRPLSK